jgi:hypothetical protein
MFRSSPRKVGHKHRPTPGGGRGDPVGCAKGAARAVRTRMLGPPRGQNRATLRISLAATAFDFAHPTRLVGELNTGDLQQTRRNAGAPLSIFTPPTNAAPPVLSATRFCGSGRARLHAANLDGRRGPGNGSRAVQVGCFRLGPIMICRSREHPTSACRA